MEKEEIWIEVKTTNHGVLDKCWTMETLSEIRSMLEDIGFTFIGSIDYKNRIKFSMIRINGGQTE